MLVRKETDLSISGSRSIQCHPVDLLGANVEEAGYPGLEPTLRPKCVVSSRELT